MAHGHDAPVRAQVVAAIGLAVVGGSAAAGYLLLTGANDAIGTPDDLFSLIGVVTLVLGFALVGAALAVRVSRNPIGWLMVGVSASLGLRLFLEEVTLWAWTHGAGGLAGWTVLGANVALAVNFALLVSLIVVFPRGGPAGRWWRASLGMVWAASMVQILVAPFTPYVRDLVVRLPYDGIETAIRIMVPSVGPSVPDVTFFLSLPQFGVAIAGMTRIVLLRFRGSPVERLQIRWVAYAVLATLALLAAALLVPGASVAAGVVAGLGIPLAIAVAVTRHRLYDIDRVVSRTVTYLVVIGLLACLYLAGFYLVTRLLPFESEPAVAVTTLGVVALFAPLRRRVQDVVNRRFNRIRYVADHELEAFTLRLREGASMTSIESDLVGVLGRTLHPTSIGLWIRPQGERAD